MECTIHNSAGTSRARWGASLVLRALVCGLVALLPLQVRAQTPLQAQTLKLPSGPSSLKGLGESFSANAATGTGSYSVPLAVPPGLLTPSLALQYSGGLGKGALGLNWRLPLLHIYRSTDKGSPKGTPDDHFAVSGPGLNEELVLVDAVRRAYRLKNEGAFALFTHDVAGDSWTVHMPNGETAYVGESGQSRERALGRTYRWYVERRTDRFRHEIHFFYLRDGGRLYPREIRYQLHAPVSLQNRVLFDYEQRPDRFVDYRYGEGIRCNLRLREVAMVHGSRWVSTYTLGYETAELTSLLTEIAAAGEEGLALPTLRFSYLQPSRQTRGLVAMAGRPPLDELVTGRAVLEDVDGDALPDAVYSESGEYHYYKNLDGFRFSRARTALPGGPGVSLLDSGVQLLDANGDGYRDLLRVGAEAITYYPGGDIADGQLLRWGQATRFDRGFSGLDFASARARLSDLNSDGRIDVLVDNAGFGRPDRRVINEDDALHVEAVPALPSDADLGDSRVDTSDFNGDGVLDLVRKDFSFSGSRLRVWFGLGNGRFSARQEMGSVPAGSPEQMHLLDVNRDGQTDLLRLSGTRATYYLNDGRMRFTTASGTVRGVPATSSTQKLLFADMNGNGTTDVVWITRDLDLYYLDLMREPNPGLLSRIDNGMGLVTHIAYESSTEHRLRDRREGRPWKTPMPLVVPLITEVQVTDSLDQLGVAATVTTTTFDYQDGYYDAEEREFRGFAHVTRTEWGTDADPRSVASSDGFGEHDTRVSELFIHVGRDLETGEDQEALKGKEYLKTTRNLAGDLIASLETRWETRWLCQEALPGGSPKVLPRCNAFGGGSAGLSGSSSIGGQAGIGGSSGIGGPAGGGANRVLAEHKDELVALPVYTATLAGAWENTKSPRYSGSLGEYDVFGQKVIDHQLGEVRRPSTEQPGARPLDPATWAEVPGDEVTSERVPIHDLERWLIGLVAEEKVLDPATQAILSHRRNFYDGAAFQGLPLGQVTHGVVTRREAWLAEEQRWIPIERKRHDTHGHVIVELDPTCSDAEAEACARRVEYEYDAESSTFPLIERRQLPSGPVEFVGTYDRARGNLTRLRDLNGHETRLVYDGLGRMTQLIDPLTSEEEPAQTIKYTFGTPNHPISTTEVSTLHQPGVYRTSFQYSDGAGTVRLTKSQAEDGKGWIGTGWSFDSPLGKPLDEFDAFRSSHAGFEPAPASTPRKRSSYDALDRLTRTLASGADPAQGYTRIDYLPFETHSYDERATGEGDLRFPRIEERDGLGRVVEVLAHNLTPATSAAGSPLQLQQLHWSLRYDPKGNLTELRDPRYNSSPPEVRATRHRRLFTFDSLDRLTDVLDPNLGSVHYRFDDADRRLSRRDALGQLQEWHYDTAGRLKLWVVSGDANGRSNYEYRYHYDEPDPDGPLPHAQNLLGALAYVEHPIGASYHGYDVLGRATVSAEALWDGVSPFEDQTRQIFFQNFELNLDGTLRRSTQPAGLELDFVYNPRGGIERIDGGVGERRRLASGIQYDVRGQVLRVDNGNGTRSCRRYDPRGRLTGLLVGKAADTACTEIGVVGRGAHHLTFEYGFNSLLSDIDDRSQMAFGAPQFSANFRYDRLNQLIGAEQSGIGFSFAYDDIQNLIGRQVAGEADLPTGDFHYGEAGAGPNQLTSTPDQAFGYDGLGQLERYRNYELQFDAQGQLVAAQSAAGRLVEFYYDHQGERRLVRVREAGSAGAPPKLYQFVFDGYQLRDGDEVWTVPTGDGKAEILLARGLRVDAELLGQLSGYVEQSGNPQKAAFGMKRPKPLPVEYLDLDGDGDANFDAGDLAVAASGFESGALVGGARYLWRYYHQNHLGSPQVITDSAGDPVSFAQQHPYGATAEKVGLQGVVGFAGSLVEPDLDLGLVRFGARYYAPDLGRWISGDWAVGEAPGLAMERLLESNLYSYAQNNPVNFGDPEGRWVNIAIGAGLGSLISVGVEGVRQFAAGEFDAKRLAVAGATGAVSGAVAGATLGASLVAQGAASAGTAAAVGVAGRAASGEEQSWSAAGTDVALDVVVGAVTLGVVKGGSGVAKTLAEKGPGIIAGAVNKLKNMGRCSAGVCPCFVAGTLVATTAGAIPIERVELADRVGPATEACARADFGEWSELALEMQVEDHGVLDTLDIRVLRPPGWFVPGQPEPGQWVQLRLEELNLSGWARVRHVAPPPALQPGDRCPVTGTVRHQSFDVVELRLEGEPEPILATKHHPILSADREDWVGAGELLPGEALRTAEGTATVLSVGAETLPRTEVFNLEVWDAHRYFVHEAQVLVHNTYVAGGGVLFGQKGVSRTFTTKKKGSTFEFAGKSIDEVAKGLRAGDILPDQIPVEFIVHKGQRIAVNNRSLTALRRAGMTPTKLIDVSGNATKVGRVKGRLDEMGGAGSDVIRIRGAGRGTSAIY